MEDTNTFITSSLEVVKVLVSSSITVASGGGEGVSVFFHYGCYGIAET